MPKSVPDQIFEPPVHTSTKNTPSLIRLDQIRRLLPDHDDRRARMTSHRPRKHASIRHAQPSDTMHLELGIDDAIPRVDAHAGRAHGMVERLRRGADVRHELLLRDVVDVARGVVPVDKVFLERLCLEDGAGELQAVDEGVDVVLRGEVVCVDERGVKGVGRGEGDGAMGFGAEEDGAEGEVVLLLCVWCQFE